MTYLFTNITFFLSFFLLNLMHPLHISVTNIEYSSEEKGFTIDIKLNKKDFNQIIYHYYNVVFDSTNNLKDNTIKSSIDSYINKNFELKSGKKKIKIEWVNFKLNTENIWIKYKFDEPRNLDHIKIKNTILNDLFYDQNNLVIFKYKSVEEGLQLTINNDNAEINLK